MASAMISVFVKTLLGDLISLEVDPFLGLQGVAHALTRFDSDAFPPLSTRVFFLEDQTELVHDSILGVIVETVSHCSLVSKEEVTLPGTNASYERHYHHWIFRLENHRDLHVYLDRDPRMRKFTLSSRAWRVANDKHHSQTIEDALYAAGEEYVTPRDAHIISAVVHKMMPHGDRPLQQERKYFCECGHVVQHNKLRQHLATKLKHPRGDPIGKEFLERAAAYLARF